MSNSEIYLPGTRNNQFKMDGNGETTISYVKNWNHPVESKQPPINGCLRFQVKHV